MLTTDHAHQDVLLMTAVKDAITSTSHPTRMSDDFEIVSEADADDAPLLDDDGGISKQRFAVSFSRVRLNCFGLFAIAVGVLLSISILRSHDYTHRPLSHHWIGFENIENYFAFGDSWTDTHFRLSGSQPTAENPLGNPAFPGLTSSNGMNYVGYLTSKYNQSFIKTYNLGMSGAVIDTKIDISWFDWDDFRTFIRSFIISYTTNGQPKDWQSNNTLFSTFFGINDYDVHNKSSHQLHKLFESYEQGLSDLYDLSARNFVIFNVPPLDKSPGTEYREPGTFATIEEFNDMIKGVIRNLRRKYKDINIFEYDVHDLVNRAIANPYNTEATAIYKNTNGCCAEYEHFENLTLATTAQIERCGGLEPNNFLWLNTLHVTEPVHEAMAAEIVELLSNQP